MAPDVDAGDVWDLRMDAAPADGALHRARALLGWRPDRHRWASAPCREQLAAALALARPTATTALRLAAALFDAHRACALPSE
jgi:hypothetical protein